MMSDYYRNQRDKFLSALVIAVAFGGAMFLVTSLRIRDLRVQVGAWQDRADAVTRERDELEQRAAKLVAALAAQDVDLRACLTNTDEQTRELAKLLHRVRDAEDTGRPLPKFGRW